MRYLLRTNILGYFKIFQQFEDIFWKYLGQSLILNSHTTIDVERFEEVETWWRCSFIVCKVVSSEIIKSYQHTTSQDFVCSDLRSSIRPQIFNQTSGFQSAYNLSDPFCFAWTIWIENGVKGSLKNILSEYDVYLKYFCHKQKPKCEKSVFVSLCLQ